MDAFPENFVFTREIAVPFAELVAEETDGALSVSFTGPGAVPPLEQFEPTQAGVFDLLFTHPPYHAGTTPVGLAIDAIAADPQARREAGIFDLIDAYYQETQGMKLIAAPPTGSVGFRYYLRDPIEGTPAFDGRNIRGYSGLWHSPRWQMILAPHATTHPPSAPQTGHFWTCGRLSMDGPFMFRARSDAQPC